MNDAGSRRVSWVRPLILAGLLLVTIGILRLEGRRWWCACEEIRFWISDPNSSHCSQHLFDPYALTHLLHGVFLCGMLAILFPRLTLERSFTATVALEALWEIIENSPFVIDRYRTATAALGYEGDSIVNSVGDIASCAFGWAVARRLGWRRSMILWVAIELLLVVWIRDNLFLNVVMLLHPIEAVKQWQLGL